MRSYTPEQADAMAEFIKEILYLCHCNYKQPACRTILTKGTDYEVYKLSVVPLNYELEDWV